MTDQLALDLPTWPDQARRSPWAVRVNGVHAYLYGTRETSSWWVGYRWHNDARVCTEAVTLAGEQVHVHCENREHAEWLHGFLLDNGMARAALKILTHLENCRD